MNVYIVHEEYDGMNWAYEKKENIPESINGCYIEIETEGELIFDDSIYLDGYMFQPIGFVNGKNDKYYFIWSQDTNHTYNKHDYSCREVEEKEIKYISLLNKDQEKITSEEDAFKSMIELYVLYKSGDMSNTMFEEINSMSEKNWIEHCEEELIKIGLESYLSKKDDYEDIKSIEKKLDETAGWYIKEILEPSCSVQLYAMLRNPNVISNISNPCDKVLQYINENKNVQDKILRWKDNIKFIENPTEEQQLNVVRDYPLAIHDIKNPTKKVQEYLEKYEKINESYETQLQAVKEDGMNLEYMYYFEELIETVDENIILEVIKENPEALRYHDIWSESYDAEKINKYILKDEKLIINVLKDNPYFTQYIPNITRQMQLVVIEKIKETDFYYEALEHIPSKDKIQEVRNFEIELYGDVLDYEDRI